MLFKWLLKTLSHDETTLQQDSHSSYFWPFGKQHPYLVLAIFKPLLTMVTNVYISHDRKRKCFLWHAESGRYPLQIMR